MLTTKSRFTPRAAWQMAEGMSTRWEILANVLAILCFAGALWADGLDWFGAHAHDLAWQAHMLVAAVVFMMSGLASKFIAIVARAKSQRLTGHDVALGNKPVIVLAACTVVVAGAALLSHQQLSDFTNVGLRMFVQAVSYTTCILSLAIIPHALMVKVPGRVLK